MTSACGSTFPGGCVQHVRCRERNIPQAQSATAFHYTHQLCPSTIYRCTTSTHLLHFESRFLVPCSRYLRGRSRRKVDIHLSRHDTSSTWTFLCIWAGCVCEERRNVMTIGDLNLLIAHPILKQRRYPIASLRQTCETPNSSHTSLTSILQKPTYLDHSST